MNGSPPSINKSPAASRSPGWLPTRLLSGETVPVLPVTPLPQVTAPRVPFHDELATTKLPLASAMIWPSPIKSPSKIDGWGLGVEPTRLFEAETVPEVGCPPFTQ